MGDLLSHESAKSLRGGPRLELRRTEAISFIHDSDAQVRPLGAMTFTVSVAGCQAEDSGGGSKPSITPTSN